MPNGPPLSICEFTTLRADAWHFRDTPLIQSQIAEHAGPFGGLGSVWEEAHAHA